jgi:methylenetetrahydrofolate dehydrogenase (NADP+)/methenyltetrahydrofolate cyclohydrolase
MNAIAIDGHRAADQLLKRLAKNINNSRHKPTLATLLVGRRYDSELYVKIKERTANQIGLHAEIHRLPGSTSQKRLINLIRRLNQRPNIDGLLLQLPLPSHLEAPAVINAIAPNKDVDGLRPDTTLAPPFLQALIQLTNLGHPQKGLAVILARDTAFSDRLKEALTEMGLTAVIKAAPRRIPPICQRANLIVTLLGRGPRLTAADIRRGAVIIDGGIRQREGKTVGDVDQSAWSKAKAISPVPGGVGPLTVAYLLKNTVTISRRK